MTCKIPHHLAIIMDGNARWARKHCKHSIDGYREGINTALTIIRHSRQMGIKYLTLFVFSLENWGRPEHEVRCLMWLLRNFLDVDVKKILSEGIGISFVGDLSRLDQDIKNRISNIVNEPKNAQQDFQLRLAISYSARNEILRSVLAFVEKYREYNFDSDIQRVEDKFIPLLNPSNIPEPDLLIRTSGESRLSNFLLWEIAYTELMFVDKLWPDFNVSDLNHALHAFSKRNRRFGK